MRRYLLALTALSLAAPALAQTYVRGHTRSDGTYVQGHYRSSPNSTTSDNYSTRGNINPYTGQPGTRSPTPSEPQKPAPPSSCRYSPYC
jgi:hypothetical protein